MAGKRQLPPVKLVQDGAEAHSHLANLRIMYARVDAHIQNENTLARDLAALVRQARDISREIEELEGKLAAMAEPDDDAPSDDAGVSDDEGGSAVGLAVI